MPSGGARVRSGPAWDPKALRREHDGQRAEVTLPSKGRIGPTPKWPLDPVATPREVHWWRTLWHKPAAVAWESFGLEVEVALYVRVLVRAEQPTAGTELLALRQRMAEGLGLTEIGRRSLRWAREIEEDAARSPTKRARRATGTEGAPPRWQPELIEGGQD